MWKKGSSKSSQWRRRAKRISGSARKVLSEIVNDGLGKILDSIRLGDDMEGHAVSSEGIGSNGADGCYGHPSQRSSQANLLLTVGPMHCHLLVKNMNINSYFPAL